LGAGHGWWRNACADVLGLDFARGRARVRVAARRSIPFLLTYGGMVILFLQDPHCKMWANFLQLCGPGLL